MDKLHYVFVSLAVLGWICAVVFAILWFFKQNRMFDRLVYYGMLGGKPVDETLLLSSFPDIKNYGNVSMTTKQFDNHPRAFEVHAEREGRQIDFTESKPAVIYIAPRGALLNSFQKPFLQDLVVNQYRTFLLKCDPDDIWNWIEPQSGFDEFQYNMDCDAYESMCTNTSQGAEDIALINDVISKVNNYILVGYSAGSQMVSNVISQRVKDNDTQLKGAILIAGGGQYCYLGTENVTRGGNFLESCGRPEIGCCPIRFSFNLSESQISSLPPILLFQTFNDRNADYDAARNLFNSALAQGAKNMALVMDGGDFHGLSERQRPNLIKFCEWISGGGDSS
jgi:hypothetical protein